jgi:ketosteroid isomerase-like protein
MRSAGHTDHGRGLSLLGLALAAWIGIAGPVLVAAAEEGDSGGEMDGNTNIEIVQEAYGAFGKGDIPGVIALLTPDVHWESVGNPVDFPALGPKQGTAAVEAQFKLLGTLLSFQSFEPKQFFASGPDTVFVLGHYDRTVIKTGKTANSDFVHVFVIRDGKIASYREFQDTATLADAWRGE